MAKRLILVVDDDKSTADTLALFFELEGFDARAVYNGETAIALAKEFSPSLILLDITMPRMDGYEVARRLQQDGTTRDIFMVALTGHDGDEAQKRAREVGFREHLAKPVEPAVLRELVARLPGGNARS